MTVLVHTIMAGRAVVTGLLVAALMGIAGPALATTPSVAGSTGVHYLVDNMSRPGAACVYDSATYPGRLLRIGVRAPVVFANDRREGRIDRQAVGWRYIVQASADGSRWHVIERSSVRTAAATDHAPADFAKRAWRARSVDYHVRVILHIYWYRAGHVVATAHLQPRYYGYRPHDRVFQGGCRS